MILRDLIAVEITQHLLLSRSKIYNFVHRGKMSTDEVFFSTRP